MKGFLNMMLGLALFGLPILAIRFLTRDVDLTFDPPWDPKTFHQLVVGSALAVVPYWLLSLGRR